MLVDSSKKAQKGNLRTLLIAGVAVVLGIGMIVCIAAFVQVNSRQFKVKNAYKSGTVIFIGSQINSRVESVEKQIGSQIRKGDVLLRLNSMDIEKSVYNLRDEQSALINTLKEKGVFYSESMKILRYQNKKNEYLARMKEKDVETYDSINKSASNKVSAFNSNYNVGALSALEMKQAEDEYNHAKNQYEVGKLDMELFKNVDVSAANEGILFSGDKVLFSKRDLENQMEILSNQIRVLEERIRREEREYDKSLIRSPVDGVINEIMVNPGEVVQTGQKLMTVSPPGNEWVDAYVNEKDIRHIAQGAKAKIIFKSLPGKIFHGRVTFISSSIQPENLETTVYGLKIKNNSTGYDDNSDKFIKIRVDYESQGINLPSGVSATVLIQEQ